MSHLDIGRVRELVHLHQGSVSSELRRAATLLILTECEGQLAVLFEVRSEYISQPGEVAFPGGKIEVGESPEEAALRECYEEIGIPSKNLEILGQIAVTSSSFHQVHCFAAWLQPGFKDFRLDAKEVKSIFTVPLAYFLDNDPKYYKAPFKVDPNADFPFDLVRGGSNYPFFLLQETIPFYDLPRSYSEHVLWGFTARYVHKFSQILKAGF